MLTCVYAPSTWCPLWDEGEVLADGAASVHVNVDTVEVHADQRNEAWESILEERGGSGEVCVGVCACLCVVWVHVQTHTQSGKHLPIDDGVSTHESVLIRTALCALLLPILLFCVRFRRSDILPKVELSLASGVSLLCRHHVLCKLMTRVTQVTTRMT